MNYSGQFSVVIPTLQRSDDLHDVVELCAAHPLVAEVLVINNAPALLTFESGKVRVLDQGENIFVNPAWNLGAREARGEYLAIINDDIRFDPELIDHAAATLAKPFVGIVGIDGAHLNHPRAEKIRTRIATYEHVTLGFGMIMFLRAKDYVPIPDRVKIWGGDDWLFMQQKRPNRVLIGARVETDVSVTSGSPEFQALRQQEWEATNQMMGPVHGSRWWHRPARAIATARKLRATARARLSRRG